MTTTLPPLDAPAAQLFDVRAVAQLLDCSPRHVYRLSDAGQMPPPVRLRALVRWRRQDLNAWLAGGCRPVRQTGRGGAMHTLTPAPAGLSEGDRRRDAALQLLRGRRAVLVRRVQRAFLAELLDRGPSTSDPVRTAVPIPTGTDPRLVGAAIRHLTDLELIHRAGLSRSVRPAAHGRDLPLWAVSDRTVVLDWLAAHPDLPDPDADPADRQLTLWG